MSRALTRISIRWPPESASESTDTLVLSVGGWYVDLRVRKADELIDWALAGERKVLTSDPSKVEFTHVIDSHHNPSSGLPPPASDVGDFTKLPNGDDLETGVMPNPGRDDKMMAYEEIWRALNWWIASSTSCVNFVLESTGGDRSTKTFYGRVGKYFLAIRQTLRGDNMDFAALWQEWDEGSQGWTTRYRIGDTVSLWCMSDGSVSEHEMQQWKLSEQAVVHEGNACTVRAVSLE